MEREEAINLIKQVLPCLNIDEKIREGFETLIPELKENEDEKIRKNLIELLLDTPAQDIISHNLELSKVLAYLEKQKEQKPIFKKGDKVIWDDEEFNILDVNETEYNVGGYRVPFSRQNELHPIWQKPAEWGEEDTEMYINVASSLRGYACGLENEEHKKHIKKEIDWFENRFKSLRPSWKPSEEQMNALSGAIKCELSAGLHTRAGILQSLLDDLEKL